MSLKPGQGRLASTKQTLEQLCPHNFCDCCCSGSISEALQPNPHSARVTLQWVKASESKERQSRRSFGFMWPAPTFQMHVPANCCILSRLILSEQVYLKRELCICPIVAQKCQQYIFCVTKIFQNTIKIWKFKILRHNILLYWDFR